MCEYHELVNSRGNVLYAFKIMLIFYFHNPFIPYFKTACKKISTHEDFCE